MAVDNVDRGFAVFFTVLAIFVVIGILLAFISALFTAPIFTLVFVATFGWLFVKIYPRIIRAMEKDEL